MAIQISGTTVIDNSQKGIFNSMNPGVYSSGGSVTTPDTGTIIYNSTEEIVQVYNGSSWV